MRGCTWRSPACDEVESPSEGRFHYGVSIPMAKALAPEVLLAFAMNGEALAPEHGFPLRLVVPGYAGARSPKWLAAVTVQDAPSDNPMQQRDYKLLPPDMTADTVDWAKGITINDMPLNAAICEPAPRAELKAGPHGRARLRGGDRAGGGAGRRVGRWRTELAAGRAGAEPRPAVELAVLGHHPRPAAGRPGVGGAGVGLRRADPTGATGRHLELQGLPECRVAPGAGVRRLTARRA